MRDNVAWTGKKLPKVIQVTESSWSAKYCDEPKSANWPKDRQNQMTRKTGWGEKTSEIPVDRLKQPIQTIRIGLFVKKCLQNRQAHRWHTVTHTFGDF